MRNTLIVLAAGALLARWIAGRSRAYQHAQETPAARPEPINRWEGEGGGVPVGGSRIAAQVRTDDLLSPGPDGGTPRDFGTLPG